MARCSARGNGIARRTGTRGDFVASQEKKSDDEKTEKTPPRVCLDFPIPTPVPPLAPRALPRSLRAQRAEPMQRGPTIGGEGKRQQAEQQAPVSVSRFSCP